MIAVTCSACRLRFEASAVERRIHGAAIVCPACDAGEPIVLDLAERAANGRLQLDPPPLDPLGEVPAVPERTELERRIARELVGSRLDDIRGASPADAPPLPIYVDLDDPVVAPGRSSALGSALGPALGSGAAVMLLFFLAVTVTWQSGGSPMERARTMIAGLAPGSDTADMADAKAAVDDAVTTAGIPEILKPAPAPLTLAIAKVTTELAETDEGRVLTVRTDVRNDGDAGSDAPRLRVAIRDADGTVLHRWTTEPQTGAQTEAQTGADWIEPGETRAIVATTRRIPDGAGDVKVDFARP